VGMAWFCFLFGRNARGRPHDRMGRGYQPVAQAAPLHGLAARRPCPAGAHEVSVGCDTFRGPGMCGNRPHARACDHCAHGARHEHVSKDTSMTRYAVMSQYKFLSLGADRECAMFQVKPVPSLSQHWLVSMFPPHRQLIALHSGGAGLLCINCVRNWATPRRAAIHVGMALHSGAPFAIGTAMGFAGQGARFRA
jgi:hypothetical protein